MGWSGRVIDRSSVAVPKQPATAGIWSAQVSGAGTQTLRWTPDAGTWTVVAMRADGSAGLTVRASVGFSAPFLLRLAIEMLVVGVVLATVPAALNVVPARRATAVGPRQA